MATSRSLALALLLVSGSATAREAASPSDCQAAAARPAITNAQAAVDSNRADLKAAFALADAWSDAGCFNESLKVLQGAQNSHPANQELETRLRVATSLVGEAHFFDNLDRANIDAKLKRVAFRCNTLGDVDACGEATRLNPDDPALQLAQGDALLRVKRPADALVHYRRAAALAPNLPDAGEKVSALEKQLHVDAATSGVPGSRNAVTAGSAAKVRLRSADGKSAGAPTKVQLAQMPASEQAGRRYTNAAQEDRSH